MTSVLALAVAALALWRSSRAPDEFRPGDGPRELLARVEALEQRGRESAPVPTRTPAPQVLAPSAPTPSVDSSGPHLRDLERRLAALEEAFAKGGAPAQVVDLVAKAESARRIAIDRSRTDSERVAALDVLRTIPDARTHEVVAAMLDVLRSSKDVAVRRGAIHGLHGTKDPALVEPLIDALERDEDAGMREVAASDLDDFIADPRVVAALRRVVDDPRTPFRVLHQAASTLFTAPK